MENTFTPYSKDQKKASNIAYLMKKWRSKNTNEEKSGSFNLELYLDYLAVINEQPTK